MSVCHSKYKAAVRFFVSSHCKYIVDLCAAFMVFFPILCISCKILVSLIVYLICVSFFFPQFLFPDGHIILILSPIIDILSNVYLHGMKSVTSDFVCLSVY